MDDAGPAGAMSGESTGKQVDEGAFAKQWVLGLHQGTLKQRYGHRVLVAEPITLGRVRPLPKETVQRLVLEMGKAFANAPFEDAGRALT